MDEFVLPPNSELLFEANRGQFIPQNFAEDIDKERVSNVHQEDYEYLEFGPEHDLYWETWERVLSDARLIDSDGTEYFLYQDGDVWLVPVDAPVYDEENMTILASHISDNISEKELRDEHYDELMAEPQRALAKCIADSADISELRKKFADDLKDQYESETANFFCDAERYPEAFKDPLPDEYAEIANYVDSIQRYVTRKAMPGHFLTRVLENDLSGAMAHADLTSQRLLPVIVKYVYNRIPAGAWGSKEAVQHWWSMRGD